MSRSIGTNISLGSIVRIVTKDMIFFKISPIFPFSGRHLEFLKMLKGENFTPTWISLYKPLKVIISREKSLSENFGLGQKCEFHCRTNKAVSDWLEMLHHITAALNM